MRTSSLTSYRRNAEQTRTDCPPRHSLRLRHLGSHGSNRQGRDAQRGGQSEHGLSACLGRSGVLLDNIALHQARTCASQGHLRALRSRRVRTRVQPVLLHHRSEHHHPVQRRHRNHIAAYLRNDIRSAHSEGTHHGAQSVGRGRRLLGCRHSDSQHRRSQRLAHRRHTWRPTVRGCADVVRALPLALSQHSETLQSDNHEQVDVHVGYHPAHAVPRLARRVYRLAGGQPQDMARNRLRGILRHLHRLSVYADGATHAAPHRGEHLQLYAARGGGIGEHRLRHVPLHVEASRGCSARLQWRMARNQVKIAKGYGVEALLKPSASVDTDICVDRYGHLHRPIRTSAPTDTDIRADRYGHLRRPIRTSLPNHPKRPNKRNTAVTMSS